MARECIGVVCQDLRGAKLPAGEILWPHFPIPPPAMCTYPQVYDDGLDQQVLPQRGPIFGANPALLSRNPSFLEITRGNY